MKSSLLALGFLVSTLAVAQEGWIDRQGHPVPDTPGQKSVDGFGGWIVVTPDADWEEKWNTPDNTPPYFPEAKTVERGKRLFVLIFFANPRLTNMEMRMSPATLTSQGQMGLPQPTRLTWCVSGAN